MTSYRDAELIFDLLKQATFFHPSYKSMKSIEEVHRIQLKVEIKAEMESLNVERTKHDDQVPIKYTQVTKSRVSLESEDEDDDDVSLGVSEELEKYISETKMPENMDPLGDFWKKREHLYPRLAILAKKYLAVQATSSPSERVVSKLNNVVSKKRNRITPSHTNQTIFLSKRL